MHDNDNETARRRASTALDAYGPVDGLPYAGDQDYTDPALLLQAGGDLIGDLMHLADNAGLEPELLLDKAREHHDAEARERGNDV